MQGALSRIKRSIKKNQGDTRVDDGEKGGNLWTGADAGGWWGNVSVKSWDYCTNPDLEFPRAFSSSQLALSVLVKGRTCFLGLTPSFRLTGNRFDRSAGELMLWTPLPVDQDELTRAIQASKSLASWL